VVDGLLLRVRLQLPSQLDSDVSDTSESPEATASDSDGDRDSVHQPALCRSSREKKPTKKKKSAMMGPRPKGFSWQHAALTDFGCTKSIEEHIPNYKGRGQLPFPVSLLLDKKGIVNLDKKYCYTKVSEWRNLTQKRQQGIHDFHNKLDKELKKLEAAEKRVTDRAAREENWNTTCNNNRREKRRRMSAAAAATGDGGKGEEEQQVSIALVHFP
jgi:hypothetical protein